MLELGHFVSRALDPRADDHQHEVDQREGNDRNKHGRAHAGCQPKAGRLAEIRVDGLEPSGREIRNRHTDKADDAVDSLKRARRCGSSTALRSIK